MIDDDEGDSEGEREKHEDSVQSDSPDDELVDEFVVDEHSDCVPDEDEGDELTGNESMFFFDDLREVLLLCLDERFEFL
jgi:hypothetical protein